MKIKKTTKYKGYREQYIECKKNNTAYYEKCHCCSWTLIIYRKHGGQCSSEKCKAERMKETK